MAAGKDRHPITGLKKGVGWQPGKTSDCWRDSDFYTQERIMKLLPIKNYPNYRVDIENHICYCVRGGIIKPMKIHAPHNEVILYAGGQKKVTMARLEFCVMHGISPDDIPKGYFIIRGRDDKAVVVSRQEIAMKSGKTRKLNGLDCQTAQRIINTIKNNDIDAFMCIATEEANKCRQYFIDHYHRSQTVLDDGIDMALRALEEKARNGVVVFDIFRFVKKYVHARLDYIRRRRREWKDYMSVIDIQ